MSQFSDKNRPPVTLFPHSYLSEKALRGIVSSFGTITVYQPWFMEPPPVASQKEFNDTLKVMNPPPDLKPGEGFMSLLSEYKTWMKEHRDKSGAAFLKVSREMGPAEESSWEIRKALRKEVSGFGRNVSNGSVQTGRQKPAESPAVKWHIILHLARDFEEDRREADSLLGKLKDRGSPLEDLLGEEDVKNPLMDLNPFESDPHTTIYPMDLIIEAWFALFGGYLKEDELLLTLSRQIMAFTTELWDTGVKEGSSDVSPENVLASQEKPSIETHNFPSKTFLPISNQQSHAENKLIKCLSGKTLILVA